MFKGVLMKMNYEFVFIVYTVRYFVFIVYGVACPKFGHPSLSSEFYRYALNTELVAAVGMLRKKN